MRADADGSAESPEGTPDADLPPSHRYYAGFHGAWQARIAFTSTRFGITFLPRWLGYTMRTTVDYETAGADGVVGHTTLISWLGIPLVYSVEEFTLDDNGQDFTMIGRMAWPLFWRPKMFGGPGKVAEDAKSATYLFELTWLGLWSNLRQTTSWDGNDLTLTQEHRWFEGVQRLYRRTP